MPSAKVDFCRPIAAAVTAQAREDAREGHITVAGSQEAHWQHDGSLAALQL
jgi:hypothetical protein